MRECDGCREPGADVTTWLATPLGMTCVTTHGVCVERAITALSDQWYNGERPRILEGPPISAAEKAKLKVARAAKPRVDEKEDAW